MNRDFEVFSDAIALPAAERGAFLDRACAGDTALRAHIEVLLQAHDEATGFLERPLATRAPAAREELSGDRLGHYQLLEKIGEGGCGGVYVAEQKEPIRRRVALKVVKLGMDTREVLARFEAERQTLALMDHPNIARVLDAGATATGRPFFVMELVRGIKITAYCDQGNLSTEERLQLFVQVCHAVQHAHQKGIIHRDLKPSNILVTVNDGIAVPKVIDFGIAKATQGRLSDQTIYTAFAQFIGTPAYMSPEQAVMTNLEIDTRSDIYSLGVLLYEMLTGRTPFDTAALLQAGYDTMRRHLCEVDPPKPSLRLSTLSGEAIAATAHHRRTVPPKLLSLIRGDLDWIVMKCLEKDRTRRYDTATSLADDLRRHLKNEPVIARPPRVTYKARKFVQRHRLGVAAGVAIAATLVLGVLLATWQAVRATRAEREQIELRMQAQANEQKALAAEALEASQRQEAESARHEAQGHAYAAEMNLAQEAYAEGRLARAVTLLENHLPGPGTAEDLRGFEWRYLWRICHEGDALVTTPAENSPVAAVAFSANGHLITCSSAGVVSVFDLASRKHRVRFAMSDTADVLPTPANAVAAPKLVTVPVNEFQQRLAVSQDGGVVALALGRGVVTLCRVTEQPETLTVPASGPIVGLALSTDGSLLAISDQTCLRLWDCSQQRDLGRVPAERKGGALWFSRDGRLLANQQGNGIRIIDVATRAELFRIETLHTSEVLAVAFSPDGRTLATSSWDTSIRLSDLASRQVIASLRGNTTHVWHLEFSPDGRTLAAAGDGEVVILWDVSDRTNGTPKGTLRGHRDRVTALAFSADGMTVATGSADGTAKVSRIGGTSSDLLEGHDHWAYSVAFSPDSKVLASGSFDGTIRFWDSRTGSPTAVIRAAPSSVFTVAFTPDGRLLAAAEGSWYSTHPTRIRLWNVAEQRAVLSLNGGSPHPRAVDISPDGRTLANDDWATGQVTLWDLPSGKEVAIIKAHIGWMSTVRFSPDGRFLATSRSGGEAKLWDVATRQEIAKFDCQNRGYGPNVDFSPDSQTLAIGWYQVELWSTEGRRLLAKLGGHKAPIMSVRYSPDGRTIATGSMDHSVKLWNVATQREVATLHGHTSAVSGLAFSADGTMLASSSEDKTIRIWRAISAAEAAALKK